MSKVHTYYLNLGSNIQPERHLPQALAQIQKFGEWQAVSHAWESQPVGAAGPNFLNACLQIQFDLPPAELKARVIGPIELGLGRRRGSDVNAPRSIDIDITLFDDEPLQIERWNYPFVVVPMAEIAPMLMHPILHEPLTQVARQMRVGTWIVERPDVLEAARNPR